MPDTIKNFDLLERSQVFQERLMDIDTLDGLVSLACSVLDCSLYIFDGQGALLAGSTGDPRACPIFQHTVEHTRQVSKEKAKPMLGPSPLCNVMRDDQCQGDTCTRLSFPLKIGEQGLPGAITFFIWDRALTHNDQALASMIAGAFAVFMRKRFSFTSTAQARKISLLRELLEFKPGLRSYYERGLAMEGLQRPGMYRLAAIGSGDHERAETLAMELQYMLPGAWVFPHKGDILCVFARGELNEEEARAQMERFLVQRQLHACASMEFASLLELRYVVEDTLVCLSLARRRDPQTCLHRAEDYLDLAFLNKCREYFPLEQYYLEGFRRLLAYDEANHKGYFDTLKGYLSSGMSVSAAAKGLFIHRNTLSQQLEKIEEILGVSLKDKDMGWYLQLCIKIHELIEL